MAITWVDGGAPAISAANLNAMVADEQTALYSEVAIATKTANYTATATDKVLLFNGTSLTATLPDPTTVSNRKYVIKNIHTTSLTVVSAGTSKTIDGAASVKVGQYLVLTVVSNGTAWFILSGGDMLPTSVYNPAVTDTASAGTSASFGVTSTINSVLPMLWADASGAGDGSGNGRVGLRVSGANNTGTAFDVGYRQSGTTYITYAVSAFGDITKLGNRAFFLSTVGGITNTSMSNTYGMVVDTDIGVPFVKRNVTTNSNPAWNVQPVGFFSQPQTKTANYTALFTDTLLIGNGSSITFTLPDPTLTGLTGREFKLKNVNSTSLTIVSAGTSKTIDGASSLTLAQWAKSVVISDGTQWLTV